MAYKQALVTGANGFIGSALCRRLLLDGVAVRAMCRSASKGRSLADAGAEIVQGDVQRADQVERYAQGSDVVFHVAAVGAGSAAHQYNVNVDGSRNVFRAALMAGVSRFVHVSTVAVYGYNIAGRIDESTPHCPSRDDFYQQSKAIGERFVRESSVTTGLPTVVIRPAMVYGPGSALWSRTLYEVCRRYPLPTVEQGQGYAHPIFVEDVVDLLVTAANHPAAPGNVFNGTPDPAPTWAQFLGYYARMAGNTSAFEVPVNIVEPLARLVTLGSRLIGRPVDAVGALGMMGRQVTYSMENAARLLDWQPHVNLEEGMALTQPWLKALTAGSTAIQ